MPTMLLTMPLLLTLRHGATRCAPPLANRVLAHHHQARAPQLVPAPTRPEHHQLKLTSSCNPRALPVHALRRGAQRPCGSL